MNDELRLATAYRAQGMLTAQVIKAKLEAAGIPAMLKYEAIGQVLGLTVDGLGLVEVQVPEDLLDEARDLLEERPGDEDGSEQPPGNWLNAE